MAKKTVSTAKYEAKVAELHSKLADAIETISHLEDELNETKAQHELKAAELMAKLAVAVETNKHLRGERWLMSTNNNAELEAQSNLLRRNTGNNNCRSVVEAERKP